MAFELPPAIYSPQLLESVVYDLDIYLEWYRQSKVKQRVGAKPMAEPTHSAETALVIETYMNGKTPTLEALEKLVEELKGVRLPEIHITLAALPNHAQREALVNEISTRLQSGTSVEMTLTSAARSLKDVLKANRVAIRLGKPPVEMTNGENS